MAVQTEPIASPGYVRSFAPPERWVTMVGGAALAAGGLLAWWSSAGWLFASLVAAPAVIAARIDMVSRRLPDHLLLLALLPTLVAAGAEATSTGASHAAGAVVLGMLAMGFAPFVSHAIAPDSMGFGDVKMAIVLGAALGTWAPMLGLVALAIASLLALIESVVRRRTAVAFGPALVGGFIIAALFVSPLAARLGRTTWGWFHS